MRRFFIIVAVTVLGALALQAGVRDDFKAHPKMSANNYQAYPDSVLPALTAAPAGYEPFFINHYGRHGSRWLINEKKYTYPLQMLERASATASSRAAARRCSTFCARCIRPARGAWAS